MGIEVTREYLEKRLEIAQKELGDPTMTVENIAVREEAMFWKGASAALDLTKAIDEVA